MIVCRASHDVQDLAALLMQTNGIATFGDPLRIHPLIGIDSSKVKSFCATGDNVCEATSPYPVITAAHLMYANSGDTTRGSEFVAGLAA